MVHVAGVVGFEDDVPGIAPVGIGVAVEIGFDRTGLALIGVDLDDAIIFGVELPDHGAA